MSEGGEHLLLLPAPSLPLLLLLPSIPRALGSSGFESAVPSGSVGALPEGTAWGKCAESRLRAVHDIAQAAAAHMAHDKQ